MVEVILREDVENLGSVGDVVDVKPGFARNYLVPQGKAYEATAGNKRRLNEDRQRLERVAERARTDAEKLAAELEGRSVTFAVRSGEGGRLFGSVTNADIADKLAAEGVTIDRHAIRLEEPLKQLGAYTVAIHLHSEVRPEIKVWVVSEE
jgi:large subunit ribosomal protein L9